MLGHAASTSAVSVTMGVGGLVDAFGGLGLDHEGPLGGGMGSLGGIVRIAGVRGGVGDEAGGRGAVGCGCRRSLSMVLGCRT